MKKKRIRYIVIAVVIVVIGYVVYAEVSKKNKGPQYTTATVKRGSLVQTVEATGSIASAQELSLSFAGSGTIGSVAVDVGSKVQQGQTLASIRDAAMQSTVERARAAVSSAQADLDRLLAGPTTETITVAKQKVEQAQVTLASAQSDLANTEATEENTKQSYLDTALQAIHGSQFDISYALDVVFDAILDTEANNNFLTTNSSAWTLAKNEYSNARTDLDTAKKDVALAEAALDQDTASTALLSVRTALETTSKVLDASFDTVSGAVPNGAYPQTRIDSLKASFSARSVTIGTDKTSVQASISNLTTGLQALKTQLDSATFMEKNAETALSLAHAQLDLTVAKPQGYDINQQRARVLQAQADLNSALNKLTDLTIIAPVDGVVTAIDHKAGEQATPNQSVVRMIGNTKLQIDVDIPESDITKVAVAQDVAITLDAFGPDKKFKGIVSFIEPSQRLIQDVVYYRVTVQLIDEDPSIKPGMTANISIATASKDNALSIPLRAVTLGATNKTVRILRADGTIETREITTGIRADDGSIEILSGLQEGETVITGTSS